MGDQRDAVLRVAHLKEPVQPDDELPRLPRDLTGLTDQQLMSTFSQFTAWADFFSYRVALDEVEEKFAEDLVRKLEDLFMLANRPARPQSGVITVLKASMEGDADISSAREEYRTVYARRKLMQTFFESAERDAAVLSRELTRRTGMDAYQRRADRHRP